MPYPESCPECGGPFRNTGTHFTARRNEIGRHVLLELGCQNSARRFWWDFTTGALTDEGRPSPARRGTLTSISPPAISSISSNGTHHPEITNGHAALSTLEPPPPGPDARVIETGTAATLDPHAPAADSDLAAAPAAEGDTTPELDPRSTHVERPETAFALESENFLKPLELHSVLDSASEIPGTAETRIFELPVPLPGSSPSLREAFVRQLQLDRLTLRQMRAWLMSDEARRAIEVAAGATEATYERLALILFGVDLPQLSGKPSAVAAGTAMSAEQRLELQREKARIRARLRRATAKANEGASTSTRRAQASSPPAEPAVTPPTTT